MSGLVSGLQNRVRRFESARNLEELPSYGKLFFFVYVLLKNIGIVGKIFITERKIHLNRK